MANNYAIAEILLHHNIITDDTPEASITDEARAAGLIYACLGCGSVGGIDPMVIGSYPTVEAARVATRDHIDPDALECCPDADTIVY